MLKQFILFFTFSIFSAFGQESDEIYSVYFDAKSRPDTEKLTQIDARFYQKYTLVGRDEYDLRVASGDNLIVDETGIYLEKNRLLAISRTEIRENPAYTLRDGYLHGVLPNDSVLVALDGEQYYFLIPTKTYLYEVGNSSTLLYRGKSNTEYLIFSKEDNGYQSVLMVNFTGQKISLSAIDLDQKVFDFRTVTGKKLIDEKIPVYLLSPTKLEWSKILLHFVQYDVYSG